MEAAERTFISWDGAELFYRSWIPNKATDKALLLFHRGHADEDSRVLGWINRDHSAES